jgi:hypothetical protein
MLKLRPSGTRSSLRLDDRPRIRILMERGIHTLGDVEERLGHYVGQLGRSHNPLIEAQDGPGQ